MKKKQMTLPFPEDKENLVYTLSGRTLVLQDFFLVGTSLWEKYLSELRPVYDWEARTSGTIAPSTVVW